MKLIVKTLNGKQLPIEIEEGSTVGQIKAKIESDHQLEAAQLKLIAYGKVLDSDDKKASEFNLKEGDFIVAMVQKKKPPPKEKVEPKAEEVKQEDKPVTAAATTAPVAAPTSTASATGAAATTAAATTAPVTAPVAQQQLSPETEAAINELMAISGKPKELCLQALAAANNSPDIAFEFLMSGQIPTAADMQGEEEEYGPEDEAGAAGAGMGQFNLAPDVQQAIQALVNNPQFPLIRQRMIQDPNFSQQFMQQLSTTQPQIFNAIQQNPGILMSLILGHNPMEGMPGGAGGAGARAGGMPGAGGAGGQQPPPGSIQVSAEEMAAISRLQSLGFPKGRAAEAYFACDKNEEMAANFLFESGMEDESDALQNAMNASANPVVAEQPAAQQEPVQVPQAHENSGQPSSEGQVQAAEGGANEAAAQQDAAQANPQPSGEAQQQNNDADKDANMDGAGDGAGGAGNGDAGAGAGGSSLA